MLRVIMNPHQPHWSHSLYDRVIFNSLPVFRFSFVIKKNLTGCERGKCASDFHFCVLYCIQKNVCLFLGKFYFIFHFFFCLNCFINYNGFVTYKTSWIHDVTLGYILYIKIILIWQLGFIIIIINAKASSEQYNINVYFIAAH